MDDQHGVIVDAGAQVAPLASGSPMDRPRLTGGSPMAPAVATSGPRVCIRGTYLQLAERKAKMTRISKTSLRVLLAPVLASALACSDDSGTPSQGDSGADLSGPDARGGDLVVDGSATEDSRAPSDASDLMDIVIANVCPPSAVKELTPYALKIQYHTWCLGAYPAASCHVQVDGDRIKLTLSVQDHAHSIGCDSSGSEYHDVTCELPALPAGSYTVEDASCPSCFTAPLQVAGATEGEPTCVTISSSS